MALFSFALILFLYAALLLNARRAARFLMKRVPISVPKGAGILTYPLA